MNAPERIHLPDVQSQRDTRNLPIEAVGIKGLLYPVTIESGGESWPTVATFTMTVALPATAKGTHMSRFVELLEAQCDPLDLGGFEQLVRDMLGRLEAQCGAVEMRFPWFARKAAPMSGAHGLVDYEATWRGAIDEDGQYRLRLHVTVPATSLCPCSKEISQYGAHNQRSNITIQAALNAAMDVQELIDIAERSASCEVYGALKRADEKYVTERAYDNPQFVEDLVRDVSSALHEEPRVEAFVVEAENFESIHNHSAFARIAGPGAPTPPTQSILVQPSLPVAELDRESVGAGQPVVLKRREIVAQDTMALVLEKPAGFTFAPGQAIDVTLIDPPETDAKGSRRSFSIVSAPFEDDLVVATRARDSAFKRILQRIPLGGRVRVEGPFGSLTLHANRSRPAVFIAGGIGITPFMSILRQAAHDRLPQVILLLYSNRRPEDAAFLQELLQMEDERRGTFRMIATMTAADAGAAWHGRTAHIDAELLRSLIVRPSKPIFYVAGPPAMVAGMRHLLYGIGIEDDDIRAEDFSGY